MEVVAIGIVQMVFQMSSVGWIRRRVSQSRKPPSRLRREYLSTGELQYRAASTLC